MKRIIKSIKESLKIDRIINPVISLVQMISKSYKFFLINLMLESMRRRANKIGNNLDSITEILEALDANRKTVKEKIESLGKEINSILNT